MNLLEKILERKPVLLAEREASEKASEIANAKYKVLDEQNYDDLYNELWPLSGYESQLGRLELKDQSDEWGLGLALSAANCDGDIIELRFCWGEISNLSGRCSVSSNMCRSLGSSLTVEETKAKIVEALAALI